MSEHADTLARTGDFLRQYVVFASPEQADAVALWIGHTWVYDQFDTTPYLAVQSAEKRSGKSRLMECLSLLARRPQPAAGASLAALFRIINEEHPTLLLDEADTVFSRKSSDVTEDLRGLLNNGYRRGVPYLRVVGEGKKMHVERFDVFAPKAVASIRRLPDTVQDRSIVIALKRRSRSEAVGRFRFRVAELEALPIRESWEMAADALRLAEQVSVPDELGDRAADCWEPLIALADAAGDDWPARARRAALSISGTPEVEEDTASIRLLAGIRGVFTIKGAERLSTGDLIEALRADDEAPWAEWNHGRGLRPEGLAYLLRPYGIRAHQMKLGGVNLRGFARDDFADAFSRYLPLPQDEPLARYPATSERESEHERSRVASETPVAGEEQDGPVAGREQEPLPFDDPPEAECLTCGGTFPTAASAALHLALNQCPNQEHAHAVA
jgi:hypothetical protein